WDLCAVGGVLLSRQAAAGERARICVARDERDRDQRDLLRPPETEELGSLGEGHARRIPVRGQGLALLRNEVEARRSRRWTQWLLRPRVFRARAQAWPDPLAIHHLP